MNTPEDTSSKHRRIIHFPKILQDEFEITMTKSMESEVHDMTNLSQSIEARGIAIGIEQGELLKAKDMAYNLARMGVSLDKIAEAAKVSIQIIKQWLDSSGMSIA